MDAFGCFFCLQYCNRKEKKISAKIYLKEKSLDLFDQFISVAEREINSIRYGLSCLVIFV